MEVVRRFEQLSSAKGHQSLVKEACKFAEELDLSLDLSYPDPKCCVKDGPPTPIATVHSTLQQRANGLRQQKIEGREMASEAPEVQMGR